MMGVRCSFAGLGYQTEPSRAFWWPVRDEDMPMLPPKPSMQMTHMELDECKETTLHDVNIEEEMRIKTRSSTRRFRL
ncbi:hypothetical protein Tco_1446066 [Tanacetum coccineum]